MSVEDVDDLVEHWKDAPSVADCVRAYLGVKPRPSKKAAGPIQISDEELKHLITVEKALAETRGKAQR